MKENWRKVKLVKVCEFKYGRGLPKRKRIKGKFPVYGSGGIVDYHNIFFVKGPGIIIGRKGTIGSVYFEKRNFFPIDTVFYIEENKGKYNLRFLSYVLKNLDFNALNSDAAVPGLNRNVAYSQKVFFTDLLTQNKIASILSAYDDLIENNNHRIKILEEMAQLIYKEWFVKYRFPCLPPDYKPVGAGKPANIEAVCTYRAVGGLPVPADGAWFIYVLLCKDESFYIGLTNDLYRRWYEHKTGQGAKWTKTNEPIKVIHWEQFQSKEEAAEREKWLKTGFGRKWLKREYEKLKKGLPAHELKLMQVGKMVDSKLGKIPEGWKVENLSDLVTTQYGYTESASNEEIGPKFLRGTDINKTSYIDWSSVPYCIINEENFEKDLDAVFASYLIRIKILNNYLTNYYLFYFLLSDEYQNYITGASTGTTRKSASAGVVTSIKILVPPIYLITKFEAIVSSLRRNLNNYLNRISILKKTRDLLLPKLISGKIDVEKVNMEVKNG